MSDRYQSLGASASKSGLHKALLESGLSESHDLFAQVMPDIGGNPDFVSFLHADGAGTKSIVAYLMYRETGSLEHFAGLAQDALVMNLDDIFCIGTPESLQLTNLIARNARLIPDDALRVLFSSYQALQKNLADLGINLALGGGETADVGDVVRTLLVDAVLGGRIKKKNLIQASSIKPGDVIVGLSSTGKASYEEKENSGLGSNGLTLARHALLKMEYLETFPEIADSGLNLKRDVGGKFALTDSPKELGMKIGEALLSPTRTYAPLLIKIYEKLGTEIHGAIHLTGGGQTKMLRFGKGNHYIKDNLFPIPKLFQLIMSEGKVSPKEMYQVFNMGHRMELYLEEKHLKLIEKLASGYNIETRQIGRVHANTENTSRNRLSLKSSLGEFDYAL